MQNSDITNDRKVICDFLGIDDNNVTQIIGDDFVNESQQLTTQDQPDDSPKRCYSLNIFDQSNPEGQLKKLWGLIHGSE